MSGAEVRTRAEALTTLYLEQGVTFDIGGEERAFPLDIMPRVIEQDAWTVVDRGVQQRVKVLELFLDDVYDTGRVFEDGVIPRSVVTTSSHYHRVAAGVHSPNGVRIHVAGIDLIRDAAGDFRVLEDNVRVPSGVSYVMTNRRAISAALSEAFTGHRIRPVGAYPRRLLNALRASAPAGIDDPTVVVLTPGVFNGAYFEHALLARTMGIELVEGRDLVCQRGRVMMRTTQRAGAGARHLPPGRRRVPRPGALPGRLPAGLPRADERRPGRQRHHRQRGRQRGRRRQAGLHLPARPDPLLPGRGAGAGQRGHLALRRRPGTARRSWTGSTSSCSSRSTARAARASSSVRTRRPAELEVLRAKVLADPRAWIAQPVVQLSTVPTLFEAGMRPRHVDLRPFAVNDGHKVWVLPGGLTRVALPEGELIVNSSRGRRVEGHLGAGRWAGAHAEPGARAAARGARPAADGRARGGRQDQARGAGRAAAAGRPARRGQDAPC